jgi:ABC-type amino acid transport system permease subunit
LNPYIASLVVLALNTFAFNSEIWRAATQNFSSAQIESAKSFGMTKNQAFRRIVLPQIWWASLPVITNKMTFVVKASPAVGIIGLNDLARRSGQIAASTFEPLPILATSMVIYIVVLLVLTQSSRSLSKYYQ